MAFAHRPWVRTVLCESVFHRAIVNARALRELALGTDARERTPRELAAPIATSDAPRGNAPHSFSRALERALARLARLATARALALPCALPQGPVVQRRADAGAAARAI